MMDDFDAMSSRKRKTKEVINELEKPILIKLTRYGRAIPMMLPLAAITRFSRKERSESQREPAGKILIELTNGESVEVSGKYYEKLVSLFELHDLDED